MYKQHYFAENCENSDNELIWPELNIFTKLFQFSKTRVET